MNRLDRARGALLGLAVGDAIGTTVEFKPRGSFAPLTDMVGGGPFGLLPGQWTDDTSMALCLGYSLIETGFDVDDQMARYLRWRDTGYMSCNGRCFDIGNATNDAIRRYRQTGNPLSGSTHPHSAGNGSIMRLAPVPIYYMDNPDEAMAKSEEQSKTTHQVPECLQACRLLAQALVKALQGAPKSEVLQFTITQPLSKGMSHIAQGDYTSKTIDHIHGTGYVVQSLEAALWCFWKTDNFRDCVLQAANLGDDADTTAAVAGQLAGAFYGVGGIPEPWVGALTMAEEIFELGGKLGGG